MDVGDNLIEKENEIPKNHFFIDAYARHIKKDTVMPSTSKDAAKKDLRLKR